MRQFLEKKIVRKMLCACMALCMLFTLVQPTSVQAMVLPGSTSWSAGDLYYFLNYYGSDSAKVASIDGNTVTLLTDVDLTEEMIVAPSGKDIVLDLNGYKLTTTKNIGTSTAGSSGGGSFTIKNSQRSGWMSLFLAGETSQIIGGYDTLNLEQLYINDNYTRTAEQMILAQYGTLNIKDCLVVESCTGSYGLCAKGKAKLNITNDSVIKNNADKGVGYNFAIYLKSENNNSPSVTINNSKVCTYYGIAIFDASAGATLKIVNQSTIYTMESSIISAPLAIGGATTTIDDSTIGKAEYNEIAIIVEGETASLNLKNNTKVNAKKCGVYFNSYKSLSIDGATIKSVNEEEAYGVNFIKRNGNTISIKNADIYGTTGAIQYVDSSLSASSIPVSTFLNTNYMTSVGALNRTPSEGKYDSAPSFVSYAKPKTTKLSKTSVTYTGKAQSPTLSVLDADGKALKNGTDYTVTTPSGRTNVGAYKYKVTYKGKYAGVAASYVTLTIVPKGTAVSKLTATKGGFKASWSKQATQTTGYQLQYSTSSSFASPKTVTVSKNSTVSTSVSKLTKGKKYYVRIRTFKTVGSTKYYSTWSAAKTVTTKK